MNESMLTGESVPVSKFAVRDEDLARWRGGGDVGGDAAKSFLYAGTKVVRVRGALGGDGSAGRPALALVVRTGALCAFSCSSYVIERVMGGWIRLQYDKGIFG